MIKRLGFVVVMVLMFVLGVSAQTDGFTIQADEALQEPLTALYEAAHEGAPEFVDEDGDLLASAEIDPADYAEFPAFFLPDAALVAQTDNEAAREFMQFAISPDGQQALIDAGFLPDVVTVTDQVGNVHEIPQPVRSSLSPYSMATYLIYGVGAGDTLVGAGYLGARDPLGAAAMERIDPRFPILGDIALSESGTNVEEIAILQPDVIFTSARTEWLSAVEELGIPIVLFEGESPELLKESMLITGEVFGPHASAQAQIWVEYYDAVFEAVVEVTDMLPEESLPRVLFTGTNALRVASGAMYQSAMVEAAGGISVSDDLAGYWNDVNLEQVLVWQPDVIFVPPYGGASVEAITDSSEWQILDAVQNGRVHLVPKLVAPWDTPVPDSVLGIMWMASVLYPDLVDFDCEAEVTYFYKTFYGYDILNEELERLCAF